MGVDCWTFAQINKWEMLLNTRHLFTKEGAALGGWWETEKANSFSHPALEFF
jgi:hypothetical protein